MSDAAGEEKNTTVAIRLRPLNDKEDAARQRRVWRGVPSHNSVTQVARLLNVQRYDIELDLSADGSQQDYSTNGRSWENSIFLHRQVEVDMDISQHTTSYRLIDISDCRYSTPTF